MLGLGFGGAARLRALERAPAFARMRVHARVRWTCGRACDARVRARCAYMRAYDVRTGARAMSACTRGVRAVPFRMCVRCVCVYACGTRVVAFDHV